MSSWAGTHLLMEWWNSLKIGYTSCKDDIIAYSLCMKCRGGRSAHKFRKTQNRKFANLNNLRTQSFLWFGDLKLPQFHKYILIILTNVAYNHRLNMEVLVDLQSLFALHVTWCAQLYSLAETPQPPQSPRIWTRIRGLYWSAKTDDISL